MSVEDLVQSTYIKKPSASGLEQAAANLNITVDSLLDAIAREVAVGYLGGKYSWEFGDVIMNNIYSCAYAFDELSLPEFALGVYLAF
ncbi:MAG: hypothetical protein ACLQBU_16740 [Terriglobales bacterium]